MTKHLSPLNRKFIVAGSYQESGRNPGLEVTELRPLDHRLRYHYYYHSSFYFFFFCFFFFFFFRLLVFVLSQQRVTELWLIERSARGLGLPVVFQFSSWFSSCLTKECHVSGLLRNSPYQYYAWIELQDSRSSDFVSSYT